MKLFDEIVGVAPEAATPENPHYERLRIGVKWVATGLVASVLGLAGDSVGIKDALGLAASGTVVMELGVLGVGLALTKLPQSDQHS